MIPGTTEPSGDARFVARPDAEPVFVARDGAVFYRGTFHSLDECERILNQFRSSGPWAALLVLQLETAMQEAYEDVHA